MKSSSHSLPTLIQQRFHASSYVALRQLNVEWVDDVVVVSGQLRSHYLKQIARSLAQGIATNQRLRVELAVSDCP